MIRHVSQNPFPPKVLLAMVFITIATEKLLNAVMSTLVAFYKILPNTNYSGQWTLATVKFVWGLHIAAHFNTVAFHLRGKVHLGGQESAQ